MSPDQDPDLRNLRKRTKIRILGDRMLLSKSRKLLRKNPPKTENRKKVLSFFDFISR